MHMADALLSPQVGCIMWLTTAATISYCAAKVQKDLDDRKIPLMGVLGAFIFAAQMINFTIPATGSSGHLGGGMILAILLGPHAAFLTIASVLTVQALFFADGGLLALGCNIFNLGIFPCFIAYPLIYKPIAGNKPTPFRISLGALLASIIGLQLGALGVVLETVASGISELPLQAFLLVMLPIHLAIGLVEGLVTAAVINFVRKARPEILHLTAAAKPFANLSITRVVVGLGLAAVVTGSILSWFASPSPDGLEWSIAKVTGTEQPAEQTQRIHSVLATLQEKIAFLPDYGFSSAELKHDQEQKSEQKGWPEVDSGTTISGLTGGALTFAFALIIGLIFKRRNQTV